MTMADEALKDACAAFSKAWVSYPDGSARTPVIDWFHLDAQDAMDFGVLKYPSWTQQSDICAMEQEWYVAKVIEQPMRAANASLLSRVENMEKDNERLAEFARSILRIVFDGGDIDGGTAQDMGVEYGLLERQDFDPKRHTDSTGYAEPGDDWYVFSGPAALQTQEGE